MNVLSVPRCNGRILSEWRKLLFRTHAAMIGFRRGIGAVPPLMLNTLASPGGLPVEVLDGLRKQLAASRAQFYLDFASGPFYGFNRPGAKASQGVIQRVCHRSR
jgi:hypothetical protein